MKLAEGRPRSCNNRDTLVTKLPFLTEQLSYQSMQLFCEQTHCKKHNIYLAFFQCHEKTMPEIRETMECACAEFDQRILRKPQRLTFPHRNQVRPTGFEFCRDELRSCGTNSIPAQKSEPPWLPQICSLKLEEIFLLGIYRNVEPDSI